MTGKLPCTCQEPCLVELDMGCPVIDNEDDERSHLSRPGTPHTPAQSTTSTSTSTTTSRQRLIHNLKHLGWSPLRCYRVGTKSPSHQEIATLFRPQLPSPPPRDNKAQDTDDNHKNNPRYPNNYDPRFTYRAAESGGTEQVIEPKESLELEQSKIDACTTTPTPLNNNNDHENSSTEPPSTTSQQYNQVRDWCLVLSRIAQTVNTTLGLPSNIFSTA